MLRVVMAAVEGQSFSHSPMSGIFLTIASIPILLSQSECPVLFFTSSPLFANCFIPTQPYA